MSRKNLEQKIEHILVAMDSSPASLTALQAAVELAAHFKAELAGLFIEDINLVRLAEMAFVQEVGVFSGASRRLEIRYVERQFRSQANRARQRLALLAQQAQIKWTFRVVRGGIARELLSAAAEANLVILGKVSWSPPGRRRLGSTVRALLTQDAPLTLILPYGASLGLPIMLCYDGSAVAQKALVVATQLMQGKSNQLTVLMLADGPQEAQRFQQEIETEFMERGLTVRYLRQRGVNVRRLVQTLQAEGCQMFILPDSDSRLNREAMTTLLDELECPVLLVR
jgi:nucleotide-binding universal stress UspA family protein/sulfur relay (sulfurtransferase) complex TusBCD TusD component (DsrE family)